jgi:hypothetical protein
MGEVISEGRELILFLPGTSEIGTGQMKYFNGTKNQSKG